MPEAPDETTQRLTHAGHAGASAVDWLESATLTDVGSMRSENQDACGEFRDEAGNHLLIVADGMGGHRGGATASQLCVEVLGQHFTGSADSIPERLARGLEQANERIYRRASEEAGLKGMGTTAVALVLGPQGGGTVGWVGDSRAYRFRSGRLEPLTDDHSLVAEWVRAGILSAAEAESHPRKNELLRSVGVQPSVEVEVCDVDVRGGDRFLLCSDGLCGVVSESQISAIVGYEAPEVAVRKLIDLANEQGGPDNITAQIASLPDGARLSAPVSLEVEAPRLWSRPSAGMLVAALVLVCVTLGGFAWLGLTRGGGGFPERETAPQMGTAEVPARPGSVTRESVTPELRQDRVEVTRRPALEIPATPQEIPPATSLAATASPEALTAKSEELIEIVEAGRGPAVEETQAARTAKPSLANSPFGPEAEFEVEPEVAPEPLVKPPQKHQAASDPRVEPVANVAPVPAASIEQAILRFTQDWSRAVTTGDFELHQRLALPASREQFERNYGGRSGLVLEFVLLDQVRTSPDTLNLRLRMTYGYDARSGPKRFEKERRIVVREMPEGLRYTGSWE